MTTKQGFRFAVRRGRQWKRTAFILDCGAHPKAALIDLTSPYPLDLAGFVERLVSEKCFERWP